MEAVLSSERHRDVVTVWFDSSNNGINRETTRQKTVKCRQGSVGINLCIYPETHIDLGGGWRTSAEICVAPHSIRSVNGAMAFQMRVSRLHISGSAPGL